MAYNSGSVTVSQQLAILLYFSSVLLDTTFSRLLFFFETVTCPCSSTTKCHVNLFVYNNNNNNNSTDRVRLTCMVCTNKIDNWLLARY